MRKTIIRFCWVLWWFPVGFQFQWVIEDSGCPTPDGGVGDCVPISRCQPMLNVLRDLKRPVAPAVTKQLQSYTCGSSGGGGVKVCCPSGPIELFTASGPPDVSYHSNLKLLPTDCGYLDNENRIRNGHNAALNEFPWMALLRMRLRSGKERFGCGGSIINAKYILTAAHCLTETSNLISVRVGEYSIQNATDCETNQRHTKCNPPVQDLRVEEVIRHQKFTGTGLQNDIALIRVSRINLDNESARPVCLPLNSDRTKSFTDGFVTGWGYLDSITSQPSDILQKVKLPVNDKRKCTETYKRFSLNVIDTQICLGGVDERDSCKGDSGGPMVVVSSNSEDSSVYYVQQGIVSFGPAFCGNPGIPGIYTAVPYFMDWILDNIKP